MRMSDNNNKMLALRAEYISFIEQSGKSINTANTTASQLFSIWYKCGEDYFWTLVRADDDSLRAMITDFLETYYPRQVKYKSGYLTSVRYFRAFLTTRGDSVPLPVKNHKAARKSTPIRKSSCQVLTLTGDMLEQGHQRVLADPGYGSDYRLIDSILRNH